MPQRAISYFADRIVCPLLAGSLSIFALTHLTRLAVVEWCLMVVVGATLWTLIEYIMHRVIYHRVPIFEKYHDAHHTDPRAYVGAPPMMAAAIVRSGNELINLHRILRAPVNKRVDAYIQIRLRARNARAEVGVGCADRDGRRIVTIDGNDRRSAGGTCRRCGQGRRRSRTSQWGAGGCCGL
jgi:hypothetical protein